MANDPLKASAIGASLPQPAGNSPSGVQSGSVVSPLGSDRQRTEGASEGTAGEKIRISKEARELLRQSELMVDARQSLESQPEIREDRVAQVQARLAAGVYDTKAVKDELAQRLASILGDLPYGDPPRKPE